MRFFTPGWLLLYVWLAWAVYWFTAAMFIKPAKSSEGLGQRLQHAVPLLLGMFLLFHKSTYFGHWHHSAALSYFGLPLTIGGLVFMLWARRHLGKYWSGAISLMVEH